MRQLWKHARGVLAGGLGLLALGASAGAEPGLQVVTSVLPLTWLVQEVGGARVAAITLVPPGAAPHTFEPRPSDMRRLSGASLFVRAGGGFDDWSEALASAGSVPVRSLVGPEDEPHAWLDPIRVRDSLAPRIAEWLVALDGDGRAHYAAALADFQRRLTALDAEIRRDLGRAPGRAYVAYHGAWRSFAARYGLREIGVIEKRPGQEPSPRELARLVDAARDAGVGAILVEPQLDPRTARVIADEFAGETVLVDPLGDPEDRERASYESLLRFDARAFARALGAPSDE